MSSTDGPTINTPRLLLRRWRDEDCEAFAALNADPEVMHYYPGPLSRDKSDGLVDRIEARFERDGIGQWAVGRRVDGRLLGFTGLAPATFEATFTPAIEVGWRFVMERLGMRHDPADDFDHPNLPPGDRLSRHVLYRLTAEEWSRRQREGSTR